MLHIIERTHKVKGLKEPKNIAVLADMHLTYMDEREDEYSQKLKQERSYMFPNGDRCFKEIREYIKDTAPDLVVSVGDFIDFPSKANLEVQDDFFNNDCREHLIVLGNHDWNYPRFYNTMHYWLGNVPKFYNVLKNENPLVQTVDLGGVLVVGIDTASDRIFPDTLKQLKEVIALGKPIILVMHVPFYTEKMVNKAMEIDHMDRPLTVGVPKELHEALKNCNWLENTPESDEFLEIVNDPNVPIVASLTGHLHFEHFEHDYIFEDEHIPGRVQYGLRISAPQLTDEGCVFLMHLEPDND